MATAGSDLVQAHWGANGDGEAGNFSTKALIGQRVIYPFAASGDTSDD